MKKLIILVILFFSTVVPGYAIQANGSDNYTIESAREYALDGAKYTIDYEKYIKPHMRDHNKAQNLAAVKYGINLSDREVQLVQRGIIKTYSVRYKKNPLISYYYSAGNFIGLIAIDIHEVIPKTKYPSRVYSYTINGELGDIGVATAYGVNYAYKPDGTLRYYCNGANCYNLKGKVIAKRKVINTYDSEK